MKSVVMILAAALALAACDSHKADAPVAAGPAWIQIATTNEGGKVAYDPASITNDAAAATTDVAIKVTYPNLETWTIDLPSYVEHKTFPAERVTLRFDCAAQHFAIVKREALANDGSVKETITPAVGDKQTFAAIADGGVAAAALPRACPDKG